MDQNNIKSQILKDIMAQMLKREGGKIRPKMAPTAPPPIQPPPQAMSEGGVVKDIDGIGEDSDMSPEDAEILESLGKEFPGGNETVKSDSHDAQDDEIKKEDEDDDDDGDEDRTGGLV